MDDDPAELVNVAMVLASASISTIKDLLTSLKSAQLNSLLLQAIEAMEVIKDYAGEESLQSLTLSWLTLTVICLRGTSAHLEGEIIQKLLGSTAHLLNSHHYRNELKTFYFMSKVLRP